MKVLVQRVDNAKVSVNNKEVSQIQKGMLVFIGVEKNDSNKEADYLSNKLINLRIFEDENNKMNLSIKDIKGEILAVSQFTLAGDLSRGNRPGFDTAAKPDTAEPLYNYFVEQLKKHDIPVKTGIFQAEMKVSLTNDGPVTFILENRR